MPDLPDEPADLAATFTHPGVAAAYRFRPPYPAAVFDLLDHLITGPTRTVLDLGAGEGALARPLAARVDRVDALDASAAMVRAGRQRPGGARRNLRWVVGPAESAELDGPYALVTAGASLHWMSWPRTLPRVASAMMPGAFLALVEQDSGDPPWRRDLTEIVARHSRSRRYDPGFSLPAALTRSGLFTPAGCARTDPVLFRQPVDDYVEQLHSTASLARELMPADEAAAFGAAVRRVVEPYAAGGLLEMAVVAEVAWGVISSDNSSSPA